MAAIMPDKSQVGVDGVILTDFRRSLSVVPFNSASLSTLDIPRDDTFKRCNLRLTGSFSVTYGAGSPVLGGISFMERLINRIDFVQDGQVSIKSFSPHLYRMFNVLVAGEAPERALTKQAGAFSTRLALTEAEFGGSAFQATTGYMLLNETIIVYFENPMAYSESQKQASLWNTRNVSSAEMRVYWNALSNVQEDDTSAATVTYASDLAPQLEVELVSVPSIPREADFLCFRQTVRKVSYSSAQTDAQVDLPRGALLAAVHLLVRDGGQQTRLSDTALTNVKVQINGGRAVLVNSTFLRLQQAARARHGIRAPKGTAAQGITHLLQGYAPVMLMRDGDINSCLDTRISNNIDQVSMLLTTDSSATYTNGVTVQYMTDEFSAYPKKD